MTTETESLPARPAASLRGIIERLPDGIVIVDHEGNIRFANPAAEHLFDRGSDELVGTSFGFSLVVGETTEIEIVQRHGGGIVHAELRVVETDWENEQVELVSLRDITDRKHAEELVALAPDVILATASPSVLALQQATRTIPVGSYR